MSRRPEILSIHLCPICGTMAKRGERCICGARHNVRGWFEGEPPLEVVETTALLRGAVKKLARQDDETPEEWQVRVFDFVGYLLVKEEENP